MSNAMRSGKRWLAGLAAAALGASAIALATAAPASAAAATLGANTYNATADTTVGVNEGICAVTYNAFEDDTVVDMVTTGLAKITLQTDALDDSVVSGNKGFISVAGPGFISTYQASGIGSDVLSGDQRTLTSGSSASQGAADDTMPLSFTVKPTATGTIVVTAGQGTSAVTNVPFQTIIINVGTTCLNNTVDPASSYVEVMSAADDTINSNIDSPAGLVRPNASNGYIGIELNNAYGSPVPSGTLAASATNGAVVNWGSAPTVASTSTATTTNYTGVLYVAQGAVNKNLAVTTTVTLTYNGVTYGTKTIKFTGDAASITISDVLVKPTSSVYTDDDTAFYYVVKDAAGNQIADWGQIPSYTTPFATSGVLTNQITALTGTGAPSATSAAPGNWSCAPTTGSSTVSVSVVTKAGTVLTSPTFTAACAGGVNTWTATLDKAVYRPGDIATLTITAKDSTGAAVNDFATTGADAAATGLNMSLIGTTIADKVFTGGVATFSFQATALQVGQPSLKTNMVVALPAYVATAGGAKTIAYEITNGGTSDKTIVIVGERGTVSGKPGIIVDGATTGFEAGAKMKPWIRFPGQSSYSAGSARPTVSGIGDFSWQRKTGKKTYVYFTNEDDAVKSNRVIIPAK